MNNNNLQLVQLDKEEVERNSAADVIGSGTITNQELLQMYMNDEVERNSPAYWMGSA